MEKDRDSTQEGTKEQTGRGKGETKNKIGENSVRAPHQLKDGKLRGGEIKAI